MAAPEAAIDGGTAAVTGPDETRGTSTDLPQTGAGQVAAPPAPPPPIVNLTVETLDVFGAPRTFMLGVPSTYSAESAYPLVLVLHGDGGDGPSTRGAFPFDDVSAQGAIVAYPSGKDQAWDLYTPSEQNADVTFIVSLVASLSTRFHIDQNRVFGTGFSKGAFMVNQLACRRPALFRGIAPHSGGAPYEPSDPSASFWESGYTRCATQARGTGPAAFVVHGTGDGVVTLESGDFTGKYWAYVNGCADTRSTDGATQCVRYDGCPAGKPVVYCPVPNLGHSIWTGATTAMWTFFNTF